jgi:hypothetical protein
MRVATRHHSDIRSIRCSAELMASYPSLSGVPLAPSSFSKLYPPLIGSDVDDLEHVTQVKITEPLVKQMLHHVTVNCARRPRLSMDRSS